MVMMVMVGEDRGGGDGDDRDGDGIGDNGGRDRRKGARDSGDCGGRRSGDGVTHTSRNDDHHHHHHLHRYQSVE